VEAKSQKVLEKIKKDHQNLIEEISRRSIILNEKMEKARIKFQGIMQGYKDRGLNHFYSVHREAVENDKLKEKNRILNNIQKRKECLKGIYRQEQISKLRNVESVRDYKHRKNLILKIDEKSKIKRKYM